MDGRIDTDHLSHDRGAGSRRLIEIRCGFADLARREADMADARLADVIRRTETQLSILVEVQTLADPEATRSAKEQAHRTFKAAVTSAGDHMAVEAAADRWLSEINRVNDQLRKAKARLLRERETADSLVAERDRLTLLAEAAHEMAEAAQQACLEARGQAPAADTEEDHVEADTSVAPVSTVAPAVAPAPPAHLAVVAAPIAAAEMASATSAADVSGSTAPTGQPRPSEPSLNLRARPPQLIVRLLGRDSRTLNWLVDGLAGTSPNARSAWKLQLSNLVDATIAAAIDDACFDFPSGNPFWDLFAPEEAREIARGLAALGFRYDGFGSFVDGRVPDQRDLALAIGSAGMYPVRIRYWPKPGESAHLFTDVRVASELYLASKAPELTLGELVVALGRRAELLAELWNDWDRVRPLLLSNPTV